MASVRSTHSNTRLLGTSPDSRKKQCDDQELEMRVPLQPNHNLENYENMNGFADDPSHQYEDPMRFQADTGGPKLPARGQGMPRKKKNDLYEPAKRRERCYTDSSSEGSCDDMPRRDPCWQCVRVMVFLVFFLAVAALALIGLIVLGYVPIKACTSCSSDPTGRAVSVGASGSSELLHIVKELKANLSEVQATLKGKNDMIRGLKKKDEEQAKRIAALESKMPLLLDRSGKAVNLTVVMGPRGPPGFNGSQGPPGLKGLPGKANLSSCRYKKLSSPSATPGATQSVFVVEEEAERIMAVSCSTEGASEHNLQHLLLPDGTHKYQCECAGKSTLFAPSNGRSLCYIHFWTCPI